MCQIRFELDVADAPDVLHRVLSTCRARGGDVLAVDFRRSDRHRPPHLAIALDIDERHRPVLLGRLSALQDVAGVRET